MDGIYQAWQTGLLWVCLCALGAMAAWLFLAKVAAPAWDALRRWWSLPCIQRVIVGVCVVGLSYYGATKQGWHVGYDGGIKAGATANVVTNDTVAIYWQRDTSGGVYVPETAAVYIDYRPNTATNEEWGLLAQTTVGAWGWSGTVQNATNYDYSVWVYYIPPEPVHTNGVWTYKTHFDRNGEYALPLRARVEVNGVAIATPKEKRKDAEKRPYDAEVEYLESTGTQYLQIPCTFNKSSLSSYGIELRFTPLEYGSEGRDPRFFKFADSKDATTAFGFGLGWGAAYFWSSSQNLYLRWAAKTCPLNQAAVFSFQNGNYRLNNLSYLSTINGSFANTASSLILFRGSGNTRESISGFRFSQNSNVILDLIPVRVGTVGAMYDRRGVGGMNGDGTARNDGLYFNCGTGNFGYGNDK